MAVCFSNVAVAVLLLAWLCGITLRLVPWACQGRFGSRLLVAGAGAAGRPDAGLMIYVVSYQFTVDESWFDVDRVRARGRREPGR
jgi:hypothetical protein